MSKKYSHEDIRKFTSSYEVKYLRLSRMVDNFIKDENRGIDKKMPVLQQIRNSWIAGIYCGNLFHGSRATSLKHLAAGRNLLAEYPSSHPFAQIFYSPAHLEYLARYAVKKFKLDAADIDRLLIIHNYRKERSSRSPKEYGRKAIGLIFIIGTILYSQVPKELISLDYATYKAVVFIFFTYLMVGSFLILGSLSLIHWLIFLIPRARQQNMTALLAYCKLAAVK